MGGREREGEGGSERRVRGRVRGIGRVRGWEGEGE